MKSEEQFWSWFVKHEAELIHFEADQERIFDQLATELQKVDPHLTFEFGPPAQKREFVISAGGIRSAFPAVRSLVDAAPRLEKWQLVAFRPRRSLATIVEFRGKRVDPRQVEFTLLDNGKVAGIYLFIPGFREEDSDLKQIGYILLDEALGEYDVETKLGLVKMLPIEERTRGERYLLSELPTLFDRLVSNLGGSEQSNQAN